LQGVDTRSISGRQPLHGELDPSVAEVAPAFDLRHISGLWIALEDRSRPHPCFLQRQGKGLAPKPVGGSAGGHPIGEVFRSTRHGVSSRRIWPQSR